MNAFIIDHPFLTLGVVVWLSLITFGWLFMAGAATLRERNDE
jgi:hypothetical protein